MDSFEPGRAPRQALWEPIVAALRRGIILGELPAGLHLEEPALAEKFGVSRIPIREALAHLSHEGLVRLEPRRGAFVIGVTPDDIHEIYEMRLLIEDHAIHQAVGRIRPADLDHLLAIVDRMDRAVHQNQLEQAAEPDVQFHRQIVLLGGNRRLLAAWNPIGGLVGAILGIIYTSYYDMLGSVDSHRRIVDALGRSDAAAAGRELRSHLDSGERVLRNVLSGVTAPVG